MNKKATKKKLGRPFSGLVLKRVQWTIDASNLSNVEKYSEHFAGNQSATVRDALDFAFSSKSWQKKVSK